MLETHQERAWRQQSWAGWGPLGLPRNGTPPLQSHGLFSACVLTPLPRQGILLVKTLSIFFPSGTRGVRHCSSFILPSVPWWDDSFAFWLSCLYLQLSPSVKCSFHMLCCFRGDLRLCLALLGLSKAASVHRLLGGVEG